MGTGLGRRDFMKTKPNAVQLLASALYETYCKAVGGKAFNGDLLPLWHVFSADPEKRIQSEAWIATADAAIQLVQEHIPSVVTCVYCGHEYPSGTPTHKASLLTEHIKVCTQHPMREAEAMIAQLRSELEGGSRPMDYSELANVLREKAEEIQESEALGDQHRLDAAELIRVLARLAERRTLHQAFGAPGDWGYGTPIGDALMHAYSSASDRQTSSQAEKEDQSCE